MNATIENRTVIRVASGDYCNISKEKGRITLGSISLKPEELADFLKTVPEAVEKCGPAKEASV